MERVNQIPDGGYNKGGIFMIQKRYCMTYYHTENADSLRNINPLVVSHCVIS